MDIKLIKTKNGIEYFGRIERESEDWLSIHNLVDGQSIQIPILEIEFIKDPSAFELSSFYKKFESQIRRG